MPRQPLCEVFGYSVNNHSPEAIFHRVQKLCPYNNIVPQCTKTSVEDPLGVCSVYEHDAPIIICPVRFRQEILSDCRPGETIYSYASKFLLPGAKQWDYVTEAKLIDAEGRSVGDIDVVLVEFNDQHKVTDFGILEIQAVYISGNIRQPFIEYKKLSEPRIAADWEGPKYPRPDWLSSIKRLVRQLTVKGSILNTWNKRMSVVCQRQFFDHLHLLDNSPHISESDAELAWFLYDLVFDPQTDHFKLQLENTVYMTFEFAMDRLSTLHAGDITAFTAVLDKKLANKHKRGPEI